MRKDYKFGLLFGLIVVIAFAAWMSVQDQFSVKARLLNIDKAHKKSWVLSFFQPKNADASNDTTPPKNAPDDLITYNNDETTTTPPQQNAPLTAEEQLIALQEENDRIAGLATEEIIAKTPIIDNKTTYHRIKKNETLSGLALKYYKKSTKWNIIVEANPGINVKNLKPGTMIIIPPIE